MSIVDLHCIVSPIGRRRRMPAPAVLVFLKTCAFNVIRATLPLLAVLLLHSHAAAQDTVADKQKQLGSVTVSGSRIPGTLRTAVPTQVANAERLADEGALLLSDALKAMAGVTLKDYGGVGGMKTVSVRGLGSQFSTLIIDGIAVDNSQNGQVDLGRYLVGNASYVSLSNGQEQQALLSAKAYAAGNVISLESSEPHFFMAERDNLKLGMEMGSFGLRSPSALWEHKWGPRLRTSLWANWLQSRGDYPFTLYYTGNRSDSSSREVRQHSAMHMFTADGSLFYTPAAHSQLTAKVHYTQGMHQLPGDVVHYRSFPSAQATHEHSALAQVRWRTHRGAWKMQLLGKLQSSYDQYEDSAYMPSADHYLENHYSQQEGYLSGSASWSGSHLVLNAALDADASQLHSNLGHRNSVRRGNLVAVVAARTHTTLHSSRLEAAANLVATATVDRLADLDTTPSYRRLAPYASLLWAMGDHLTLRYFYKETFRVPNFSELYFFYSIPKQLQPEKAHQHNLGATYMQEHWSATLDAYFNRVVDKIMARPGTNMFYWTMENLGLVHILGIDATADLRLPPYTLHATYSFTHAVDLSDPTDIKVYGRQIRYTPRHSGGASLRREGRWLNLGASVMAVGSRYAYVQSDANNRLPAYVDIGLTVDKPFDLRLGTLRLQVQVLNLLDTQYEVVKDYPMMGRNYRLSLTYEL